MEEDRGRGRVFQPSWKPGSGHYGDTLGRVNEHASNIVQDLFLGYLDTVPVPRKRGVFTIGDYGTSDGYASMNLMKRVIGHLRDKHGEELAIQVVYEDQEKNDFNSLFNRLSGESSYTLQYKNVFPMATNINFYQQCVPDGTCDVIYSAATFADALYHYSPMATEDELRHFRQEAASQWQDFLLLRAKELKPGGLLVVLLIASDDDYRDLVLKPDVRESNGDVIKRTAVSSLGITMATEQAWRDLRNTTRPPREITAPFDEVTSPVREAGLSLVHHDQQYVQDPYKAAFRQLAIQDDGRRAFADYMVDVTRTVFGALLRESLSKTRAVEEKNVIVEKYFDILRKLILRADLENFHNHIIYSRLVVRKECRQ
ncbi:hypothetical protein BaRGS_00004268 [Batillaria attramentaria]|uniref:Uncharacterized protein n=1 Tax=Batillaria attramentaria TaxID=370345 RepID=A0ABD0LZK2_9CAEN